jgi:hypothetical protein
MSELAPLVNAQYGVFYVTKREGTRRCCELAASYARTRRASTCGPNLPPGEGLVGQAALEKKPILLTDVPDDYIRIGSGLGEAPPRNIIVLPACSRAT